MLHKFSQSAMKVLSASLRVEYRERRSSLGLKQNILWTFSILSLTCSKNEPDSLGGECEQTLPLARCKYI